MRVYVRCLVLLFVSLALGGCDLLSEQSDQYVLRGNTMGTSYTIKALHAQGGKIDQEALYNDIKYTLDNANEKLSNWKDDSEISRFNRSPSTNWLEISAIFHEVLTEANLIHDQSGGGDSMSLCPPPY